MTWSIVARDPETGALGVAVTSCFFAVGALIPHIAPGIGAIATQAVVNRGYGAAGLRALADGTPVDAAIDALAAADEGRDVRQLHAIDADGRTAAFTGARCPVWAGSLAGDGVSVAGNTLAGRAVAEATLAAFERRADQPFAERLIAALAAGEAAGGDARGRQSAALLIRGVEGVPDVDLRADDHAAPIDELARLLAVHRDDFTPVARLFPGVHSAAGVFDPESLAEARGQRLANRERGLAASLGTLRAAPSPSREGD